MTNNFKCACPVAYGDIHIYKYIYMYQETQICTISYCARSARNYTIDIRSAQMPPAECTRNATSLGSLIRPIAVTRCNLAVSDIYMRDFGKTHQIAYTYCSVGISDLKPLTGTSADQLPHRKSQSLATA